MVSMNLLVHTGNEQDDISVHTTESSYHGKDIGILS